MALAPNIAGFVDAQVRLRTAFAEEVTFVWAPADTWPDGTVLDPETGKPMDPLVQPSSSTPHTLTVQANVAYRTVGTNGQSAETAVGTFEEGDILVIQASVAGTATEGAVEFIARGERWRVTRTVLDGIGGVQRHLTYGDRIGDAA